MIPIAKPEIRREDIKAVEKVLRTHQLSGRSDIAGAFEVAFARETESKYAVAVNSGSSALFLTLKAMGIGPGDEVIIPAYCFIAVPNAVKLTGAKPILVDVDYDTMNVTAGKIRPRISKRTKAIIVVHTYGMPCNMDPITDLKIPVIEDCAEAIGARYKNKQVGSFGYAACYSLFANKSVTAGEGGVVTTTSRILAKKVRLLKDQYRSEEPYRHDGIGYGMSLSAMQCAFALSQVKRMKATVGKQRNVAFHYKIKLRDIIKTTKDNKNCVHSYWMFPIFAGQGIRKFLKERKIETRPGFVPISMQEPYLESREYPNTEKLHRKVVCLPNFTILSTYELDYIVNCVKEYFDGQKAHVILDTVNKGR